MDLATLGKAWNATEFPHILVGGRAWLFQDEGQRLQFSSLILPPFSVGFINPRRSPPAHLLRPTSFPAVTDVFVQGSGVMEYLTPSSLPGKNLH